MMTDKHVFGQDDAGYVDLERTTPDAEVIDGTTEVVEEYMPEVDQEINDEEKKDTGFGQEPGVVIDDTTDRMARYDDNDEPQYPNTN